MSRACLSCQRRAWLISRLAGHIEQAHVRSGDMLALFDLTEIELLDALAGSRRAQLARELSELGERRDGRVESVCPHTEWFPPRLGGLPGRVTQLATVGGIERLRAFTSKPTVAIVGSRRSSSYGISAARTLGAEIAAAGVTVVSGMALGVDSAAHEGALSSSGKTIAVLAANPETAYPPSKRELHRRIAKHGVVISELFHTSGTRRWMFPARNRVIAGLSDLTLVVEAADRSGSLITAVFAREFGREVAAVPGQISSSLARGTNALIADGAHLVASVDDVLDLVLGVGSRRNVKRVPPAHLKSLYEVVASEPQTLAQLLTSGLDVDATARSLAELELLSLVVLDGGGRYQAVA